MINLFHITDQVGFRIDFEKRICVDIIGHKFLLWIF